MGVWVGCIAMSGRHLEEEEEAVRDRGCGRAASLRVRLEDLCKNLNSDKIHGTFSRGFAFAVIGPIGEIAGSVWPERSCALRSR